MEQKIGERQRWIWLASGLTAVAAAGLCRLEWLWVLLGGTVACVYYLYIESRLRQHGLAQQMTGGFGLAGKVLAVLTVFWLIVVMGRCAILADVAFPTADGFPGLGWVLLALAAWGCGKGAKVCAGCVGVLSLFLLVLYGVVVVFSAPDVSVKEWMPTAAWKQGLAALSMFLLPGVVWYLPVRKRTGRKQTLVLLLPVFAAVLTAVTAGVLTRELAQASTVPLYELSRSVSVLGVVERIEPLLSAAVTMGVFSLLAAMACACQALLEPIIPWSRNGSVCCLAAAAIMYVVKALSETVVMAGNAAFFLLFPVVLTAFQKTLKKGEKGVDKDSNEC